MNWYKKAQSLRLTPDQHLSVSDSYSESVFPNAENRLEKVSSQKILEQFADEKGYRSSLDYILCSLYPEMEKFCRDYYGGAGKKLKDLFPAKELDRIDTILEKAIVVFETKYQIELTK